MTSSQHLLLGRLPISVGIMAYNEETTIALVVQAFLDQISIVTVPVEVVVVASGCTDRTVEAVTRLARSDARIRLIVQPEREGKLAAVRHFLSESICDIVVISGADTLPSSDLLDSFGQRMLIDPGVGMVGGQIVPLATGRSLTSNLNELLWRLHHQVALRSPKLGEIVAVRRRFVAHLHDNVNCDEVALEAGVMRAGGRLAYEPTACVTNRSPLVLREYFLQRRRNRCLHLWATSRLEYQPSTSSRDLIFRAVVSHLRQRPRDLGLAFIAALLEGSAEVLARRDFKRGRDYRVWEPLLSSRRPTEHDVVS